MCAKPTADCLIQNPTTTDKIFKIRNRIGDNGVCAVFNINAENKPVSGTLTPAEIGISERDYIYYEHFTKQTGILKSGESLNIRLTDNDDFRLYSFIPKTDDCEKYCGNTEMFMGCAITVGDM